MRESDNKVWSENRRGFKQIQTDFHTPYKFSLSLFLVLRHPHPTHRGTPFPTRLCHPHSTRQNIPKKTGDLGTWGVATSIMERNEMSGTEGKINTTATVKRSES